MRKNLSSNESWTNRNLLVLCTLSFFLENILVYSIIDVLQRWRPPQADSLAPGESPEESGEKWESFFRTHALHVFPG